MTEPAGAPRLTLLMRADCGLCEEMLDELRSYGQSHTLPAIDEVDVDSDPVLQRRYGLKIPVLLYGGALVCQYRLDAVELARMLAVR